MITTRVFDIDGTEKDLAWLASAWDGCEVLPAFIPSGTVEYWRLVAIYCTSGPATLKAEVRRDGHQAGNQPVAATWPELDNPSGDIPELPASPNNWSLRGVVQRTEDSGFTGFGLSGGKEYDEEGKEVEAYGPWYHMWVLSSAPSDCLTRTGMKGGTVHNGPLHGVWVLTPVGAPDPDPDPGGDVLAIVSRIETKLNVLSQHLGADQAAPMIDADAMAVDFDTDEPSRFTATGQQHRVKRASNLRQEASIKAPIYALVNKDALVNVIGEYGDWWHVEFVGFMAKTQVGPSIDPPAK